MFNRGAGADRSERTTTGAPGLRPPNATISPTRSTRSCVNVRGLAVAPDEGDCLSENSTAGLFFFFPSAGPAQSARGPRGKDKMGQTASSRSRNRVKHALYGKGLRRTRKRKVHDEAGNACGIGARVGWKPVRFPHPRGVRVVEILEKAQVVREDGSGRPGAHSEAPHRQPLGLKQINVPPKLRRIGPENWQT